MELEKISSKNELSPQVTKNEQLKEFHKQIKVLYSKEAPEESFNKLVSEMHKQNITAHEVITSKLFLKNKKALNAIEEGFKLQSAEYLFKTWLPEQLEQTNFPDTQRIEYPQRLEKKVSSPKFHTLVSHYAQLSNLPNLPIKISDTNAFCLSRIPEQSEKFSFKPKLYLSEDFFDFSPEEQEFTTAHEITHAFMQHAAIDMILRHYVVETTIIEKFIGTVPSLKDWLSPNKESESFKKMQEILIENQNDIPVLHDIIVETPSFLKFSRAFEYQADSLFAGQDLDLAKKFRNVLYLKAQEEQQKSTMKKDEKSSTHPSWQKRFEWMDTIVKLLEAEKTIGSTKEELKIGIDHA
jgi:Zn-dependent protease with chaperone function